MSRRLRVGILFGGKSAEHEVSILSARNVLVALDPDKYEPVLIGIDKGGRWLLQRADELLAAKGDPRLLRLDAGAPTVALEPRPTGGELAVAAAPTAHLDVVFPVLHGPMGEDGTVQGLLELADLPYVGAGVLGSAVGMDKDVMKRLLQHAGVPVARFRTLRRVDFDRDPAATAARAGELGFPLFTKPANLGSSVGVRKVRSPAEVDAALAEAFAYDVKALAEEAVVGRELECSVLGDEDPIASVAGEVVVSHADGFYSYDAKYVDEHGATITIPARLAPAEMDRVRRLAVRAFQVLEASGMARVDFFLRPDGELLVNEINTIPGFTAISMYPKMWEASGIPPRELVTRLIDLALARKARRRALKTIF